MLYIKIAKCTSLENIIGVRHEIHMFRDYYLDQYWMHINYLWYQYWIL